MWTTRIDEKPRRIDKRTRFAESIDIGSLCNEEQTHAVVYVALSDKKGTEIVCPLDIEQATDFALRLLTAVSIVKQTFGNATSKTEH